MRPLMRRYTKRGQRDGSQAHGTGGETQIRRAGTEEMHTGNQNQQLIFQIGQKVEVRKFGEEAWHFGLVTSDAPLKVKRSIDWFPWSWDEIRPIPHPKKLREDWDEYEATQMSNASQVNNDNRILTKR